MHQYFENYFDLYWDLHLGVRGDAVPDEIRAFGESFNAVIGFWFPTFGTVYKSYMRVRELRQTLKDWVDARVQDIIDGNIEDAEKTLVYYWLENGKQGENLRRKGIVFECFHNFPAFIQWAGTFYSIMDRLSTEHGDPDIRAAFERTMTNRPDEQDSGVFTPLDRFVMELMRVISPNFGSYSDMEVRQNFLGSGYTGILHPHTSASHDSRHWTDPSAFDPDRYKQALSSAQNDADAARAAGFARCPFNPEHFSVKDGRNVELTNSAYGAVYGVVDGEPYPVCDYAGYAPFGFGYRRCPAEFLNMSFFKDFLRKVWNDGITFSRLDLDAPDMLPAGPGVVVEDVIGFNKG